MAGIRKRKQKKAVAPEAAMGAGAYKPPIKPRSPAYGRGAVVDSYVRHFKNLGSPPPKRSRSVQARGDAEMTKWVKKLEKDAQITSPSARRRRGI